MVNIDSIYVIMSTIAVTGDQPPSQVSLSEKELESILKRPFTIGQSPAGLVVSSQRDQIEIIAGGNKLNVRDLSGGVEFSESKIPTVLDFFIQKSKYQVSSYGVNFIITVPCIEPGQWIRDNILALNISEKIGKTVYKGAAVLNITSGDKTWNIKLEPGESNTINVDFNASEATGQIPNQDRLREELQEQFDGLRQFLSDLGL